MRKTVLALIMALPLFAGFFPPTVHSSVTKSDGTHIKLHPPFPRNGMSGIVVHRYGSTAEAITGYIKQTGSDGTATLVTKEIIHHEALPTIRTDIAKGDKVIGGYLYNTLLLLAPDADTYAKITKSTAKTWIHPDLYATFLAQIGETYPTKENLARFAKQYQVGLVYIVKRQSAVLFDPISQERVAQKTVSYTPKKADTPFFMRLDPLEGGWFSDSAPGDYYKIMERF